MNETIRQQRMAAFADLLHRRGLAHALILNPGLGNLDQWLYAKTGLPLAAPFNRNPAYLVSDQGEITPLTQVTTHPTDRDQFPAIGDTDLSRVFRGDPVGIVNPQFLKKPVRDHLTTVYPAFEWVDLTTEFAALRAVKSPEEVQALTLAAAEYDRLFTALPLVLRAERLEKEAVNELRQRIAWQGAAGETPAFHTQVHLTSAPMDGPAAALPLPWPGRRLQWGDRVNVTVRGYLPGGFSAALGRTCVLGPASEETKRSFSLALEAQTLAFSLLRPGQTLGQVTTAVNAFLQDHGSLADESAWISGLGVSAYEWPRNLGAGLEIRVQEGMVLAIGPEVRYPGQDGYRQTDAVYITQDGAVRLSRTEPALRELF